MSPFLTWANFSWPWKGTVSDIVESIKARLGFLFLMKRCWFSTSTMTFLPSTKSLCDALDLDLSDMTPNTTLITKPLHSYDEKIQQEGPDKSSQYLQFWWRCHCRESYWWCMIYLLMVIRFPSDNIGVFVLLLYWVYQHNTRAAVQMGCSKCLRILGMHYLTGSDTTSYLYGKGKISGPKTLTSENFLGLYSALGEISATHA